MPATQAPGRLALPILLRLFGLYFLGVRSSGSVEGLVRGPGLRTDLRDFYMRLKQFSRNPMGFYGDEVQNFMQDTEVRKAYQIKSHYESLLG